MIPENIPSIQIIKFWEQSQNLKDAMEEKKGIRHTTISKWLKGATSHEKDSSRIEITLPESKEAMVAASIIPTTGSRQPLKHQHREYEIPEKKSQRKTLPPELLKEIRNHPLQLRKTSATQTRKKTIYLTPDKAVLVLCLTWLVLRAAYLVIQKFSTANPAETPDFTVSTTTTGSPSTLSSAIRWTFTSVISDTSASLAATATMLPSLSSIKQAADAFKNKLITIFNPASTDMSKGIFHENITPSAEHVRVNQKPIKSINTLKKRLTQHSEKKPPKSEKTQKTALEWAGNKMTMRALGNSPKAHILNEESNRLHQTLHQCIQEQDMLVHIYKKLLHAKQATNQPLSYDEVYLYYLLEESLSFRDNQMKIVKEAIEAQQKAVDLFNDQLASDNLLSTLAKTKPARLPFSASFHTLTEKRLQLEEDLEVFKQIALTSRKILDDREGPFSLHSAQSKPEEEWVQELQLTIQEKSDKINLNSQQQDALVEQEINEEMAAKMSAMTQIPSAQESLPMAAKLNNALSLLKEHYALSLTLQETLPAVGEQFLKKQLPEAKQLLEVEQQAEKSIKEDLEACQRAIEAFNRGGYPKEIIFSGKAVALAATFDDKTLSEEQLKQIKETLIEAENSKLKVMQERAASLKSTLEKMPLGSTDGKIILAKTMLTKLSAQTQDQIEAIEIKLSKIPISWEKAALEARKRIIPTVDETFQIRSKIIVPPGERKLTMITAYDAGIEEYAQYVIPNQRAFAVKHKYSYIEYFGNLAETEEFKRMPHWSKIVAIYHQLQQLEEGEHLVWIDASVLFTNTQLNFEKIIEQYGQGKDIIVTTDPQVPINNAVFIVKNTPWTRNFVQRVYDKSELSVGGQGRCWSWGEPFCHYEQQAMTELWEQDPDVKAHMALIPNKEMNALYRFPHFDQAKGFLQNYFKDPENSKWAPGDMVCKITGMPNHLRLKMIQHVAQNCIDQACELIYPERLTEQEWWKDPRNPQRIP